MRGDQLARQRPVIRAIGASPNGLTQDCPARWGTGDRMEEKPFKSLFQKLGWAFLLWGTEAESFSDSFLDAPG
jgi:hypothetical protein